jgi:hypothetical protein
VFIRAFSAFRVQGLTRSYRCFFYFAAIAAMGCVSTTGRTNAPEAKLMGAFIDDYDTAHELSRIEWRHGSRSRYRIVKWNSRDHYFIARNDSSNPGDGGLWSRVDWVELDGMAPWSWAYCMSAFKAPSADSAESTRIANRSAPRSGCSGFPFTRMRSRP